tara:strand:+ start:386 stop:604 length:219 start_codon:yes stop_codon:yes gene_type:complete
MDDYKPVEQALLDAGIEIVDHEPAANGELEDDEDKVAHSPKLILARIKWIGDQITRVSSFFQRILYYFTSAF